MFYVIFYMMFHNILKGQMNSAKTKNKEKWWISIFTPRWFMLCNN